VRDAAGERDTLAIGYDAATGTYTIDFGASRESFAAGDRVEERFPGEAAYFKVGNVGEAQFLTILSLPFISASFANDLTYNQYVAQGYWQTNQVDNLNNQYTRFTSFVFGQRTSPADVPMTGAAHWLVDIFGALAIKGQEILTVSGSGDFEVDFAAGTFQLNSFVDESEFLSLGGTTGSLYFVSGGELRADGSFGGVFAYNGTVSLAGDLEGAFFGPGAAEIGATFAAENSDAYLSGAFTGQRSSFASTSAGISNISLTNLLADDQRLFGEGASITVRGTSDDPGFFNIYTSNRSGGDVLLDQDGIVRVSDGHYQYLPDEADRIADPTGNFDRYAYFGRYNSSNAEGNVEYAIYKVGEDNSEIQLTYLTFLETRVQASEVNGAVTSTEDRYAFSHFGIETSPYVILAMTGTATYNGVVYARAAGSDGFGADVSGTSVFNVDFSSDSYSGQLVLDGVVDGGGAIDFGTWTFAGTENGGLAAAQLLSGSPAIGTNEIRPILYGPNGQELGAAFSISTQTDFADPDFVEIAGITVATQEP